MLIANAVASRITMVVADSSSPPQSAPPCDVSGTHQRPNVASPSLTTDGLPTSPADAAQSDTHVTDDDDLHQQHFQRGLGAYPLCNRTPVALLTVRSSHRPLNERKSSALMASATSVDPKSRKQALRDDRAGWTAAERAEIANHSSNGSWELIDRSSVPSGRSLVRLIWVYKRKRSGSLKARLCVQGCAQIPGVDFEQ
eukprot:4975983-Pleurochrysis_carterae.AAC.1